MGGKSQPVSIWDRVALALHWCCTHGLLFVAVTHRVEGVERTLEKEANRLSGRYAGLRGIMILLGSKPWSERRAERWRRTTTATELRMSSTCWAKGVGRVSARHACTRGTGQSRTTRVPLRQQQLGCRCRLGQGHQRSCCCQPPQCWEARTEWVFGCCHALGHLHPQPRLGRCSGLQLVQGGRRDWGWRPQQKVSESTTSAGRVVAVFTSCRPQDCRWSRTL